MNCNEAREHLFAFADGQLASRENSEVLEHVKTCDACARAAGEHRDFRRAVRRSVDAVPVPDALKFRINASLESDARREPVRPVGGIFATRLRAYAMAASLLIVSGIFLWRSVAPGFGTGRAGAPRPIATIPGPAGMIADVHNLCCEHAARHQSQKLPTELKALGPAICAHFANKIAALAPDLSAYGYQFESANFCGVRRTPDSAGGHLLYANAAKTSRLSFFSVPRWDALDGCMSRCGALPEGCRQCELAQPNGAKLAILAWHNETTTYICCGPEPLSIIAPMIDRVRTALADFDRETRLTIMLPRR